MTHGGEVLITADLAGRRDAVSPDHVGVGDVVEGIRMCPAHVEDFQKERVVVVLRPCESAEAHAEDDCAESGKRGPPQSHRVEGLPDSEEEEDRTAHRNGKPHERAVVHSQSRHNEHPGECEGTVAQ